MTAGRLQSIDPCRRLVGTEEAADGGTEAGMGVSYQAFAITVGDAPPPVAFEVEEEAGGE